MAVSIAEYLGQRTDQDIQQIVPASDTNCTCPFMLGPCTKFRANLKPVCTVRKANGDLWIVCKNRLCSSNSQQNLSQHQIGILSEIATEIYPTGTPLSSVVVKREEPMPVIGRSVYHADYVMSIHPQIRRTASPIDFVLEMQGGGETSNTGHITKKVQEWEADPNRTNAALRIVVSKANTIETNAWRRQQEQFLVKGNISKLTGGGIIFCVGKPLYDYLSQRVINHNLVDLRGQGWDLCLVTFIENTSNPIVPGPLSFTIDKSNILFTNYLHFVQILINQGLPLPLLFVGEMETLTGQKIIR